MKSKNRTLATLLTVTLLLNIALMVSVTNVSANGTELKVLNPATGNSNFFYYTNLNPFLESGDPGYPTGNQFTANVSVFDVTGMTAWQLNLTWNPTMLKLIDIIRPADDVFAGQSTFEGAINLTEWNLYGNLLWWVNLGIGTTPVDVVEGRICQITFERIAEPGRYEVLECPIHITVVGEATFYTKIEPGVAFTTVNGLYKYIWTPPDTKPNIKLIPASIEKGGGAPIVGTSEGLFSVDVYIENLDKNWQLIGVQWKITNYNTTLLEVLGGTEGDFMAGYALNGTHWFFFDDGDELVCGVLIDPNKYDPVEKEYYWDLPVYPNDGGKLATIDFNVTFEDEFPWFDVTPIDVEPLFGEYGIDSELAYVPFNPGQNSTCTIYGYILGRMIDVYTQYPAPYGGQGINKTSDMFWPQQTVQLCAEVTYNLDPVQSKLVTFEVTSPTGLHHFVFTAETNSEGIACVEFGLPWPCADPETEIFGIWDVVASVDIREEVVQDFLWFKVDWRVSVTEVVPKQTEYPKGETAEFDIYFKTYSEQPFWALITLVVVDDLNVPIGTAAKWVEVGGEVEWCTYNTYNITLGIYLPKWAFVGTGTVKVSIMNTWPYYGGHAYAPEASNTFRILRP